MSKQPPKISTLLTRAAKYLEENGWVKGAFFRYRNGRRIKWSNLDDLLEVAREKSCPACARGALYVVDEPGLPVGTREVRHEEAQTYLEQQLEGFNADFFSVPEWNDADGRTKEEVIQGLKAAAKAARKDGK